MPVTSRHDLENAGRGDDRHGVGWAHNAQLRGDDRRCGRGGPRRRGGRAERAVVDITAVCQERRSPAGAGLRRRGRRTISDDARPLARFRLCVRLLCRANRPALRTVHRRSQAGARSPVFGEQPEWTVDRQTALGTVFSNLSGECWAAKRDGSEVSLDHFTDASAMPQVFEQPL